MHCLTAWGLRALELVQRIALLPGVVGNAIPAIRCLTAWGQWAVEFL